MKNKIIEIISIGNPKSLIQRENEPISSLIETSNLEKELNNQLKGWINVKDELPKHLETVFLSNGKGSTFIGCLVDTPEGWHWAESNGIVYEENGKIVSECESDDLDVVMWHPFPLAPIQL